jgi:magnesium chelatase subunit I
MYDESENQIKKSRRTTNMSQKEVQSIQTLGALKAAGYRSRSVKTELRENLIAGMKRGENIFQSIVGYDDTVIPELERAILSRHNILLLGLRGQAKTRIARLITRLLDEYMPIVAGSEIHDDPLHPISRFAIDQIEIKGDETPIDWIHRSERYSEKLATPDVSVADLIGDVDPIKAATQKLTYSDERVIHYGIIPRSNRGLFVINELPDLQARIQVALFNILQEGDIQIRGFKLRLPLDIQFVFTANPEDYTNRGSIVTPLKDRIESQILTHYPKTIEISRSITAQEARIDPEAEKKIHIPELAKYLLEQIAMEARQSEYVDSKSGVSARLTITAYESLVSSAERRCLLQNAVKTQARVTDFWSIIPAITGKIELVYEGEQEGPMVVAQTLLSKAIRSLFEDIFPDPEGKGKKKLNPYDGIIQWFGNGNTLDIGVDITDKELHKLLSGIDGLKELVEQSVDDIDSRDLAFYMEFCLHGMAAFSMIGKEVRGHTFQFRDLMQSMFNLDELAN